MLEMAAITKANTIVTIQIMMTKFSSEINVTFLPCGSTDSSITRSHTTSEVKCLSIDSHVVPHAPYHSFSPRMAMMLENEYQLKVSEHAKKKQILINLRASTNRLQETNPRRAIPKYNVANFSIELGVWLVSLFGPSHFRLNFRTS